MANKARKVTDEDLTMLKFFWDKFKDLEVYTCFGDIKADLKKNHYEIWGAWRTYKRSVKVLDKLL